MRNFILYIILILTLNSCSRIENQDILILYPSWSEGIAITHLAKVMMEDKGYTVKIKRLDPGPIFASISRGDADVYMGAWLPYTHHDYWEKYGDKIDILGTIFDDGITGLVVPAYVPINSIDELNENKEKLDGKIYGISSGTGIYKNTEKAIQKYKLDYNQIASSETSMIAALKKAIASKEWIVITGWKPHFMWTQFDLKPLEDRLKIYPVDEIKIISRKNFATDKPELTQFFNQFKLNEKMLNELIQTVSESETPEVGAKKFYLKYYKILGNKLINKK